MSKFAKFFQKTAQSPRPVLHGSVALTDLDPRVAVHYGIPPSASILAFDPIQRILAIGTLDGRIKIIGGDNIEGLLLSPKQLPFKNLEFLQNQGFLSSVSNENDVQVWDLEQRSLACNLQWDSNITAFSVICGTSFMYIGDEYGFLAVLKYDAETRQLLQLPYCLPANLVTEAAGISVSSHQSIVGLLPQPNSFANRVLITYENGLIILWDVCEDRMVVVRGYKDLLLKEDNLLDSVNDGVQDDQLDKEISSLCWVASDGSIVAVGYVDGDILLWSLSDSASGRDQKGQKASNNVVKLQLSTSDRRLPVIVLHWCKRKTLDDTGGNLFVYGGDEIGSEEVLTILNLDWSSGIESLRCVGRVDLTLNGSFADMILVPNSGATQQCETSSLFVLSNPGQLHFYDDSCLCSLMDHPEKKHSIPGVQYHEVLPTLEPLMTSGKLKFVGGNGRLSGANLMMGTTTKHWLAHPATTHNKWPLTGGVPCQLSCAQDDNAINRVYIAGYHDGSIRIWDATFPVLSPIFVLGSEIEGIEIVGSNASVSGLEFSPPTSMLAVGNDYGLISLYKLISDSDERSFCVVTETKQEVHNLHGGNGPQLTVVFSIHHSSVCSLQFLDSGNRLAAGFTSGCVALFDVSSSSVLFLTESLFGLSSSFIFLSIVTIPSNDSDLVPLEDTTCESAKNTLFILTGDTHIAVVNSTTGEVISSQQIHPQKLTAISMHILDGNGFSEVSCERPRLVSSGDPEAKSQSIKNVEQNCMDSLLLFCFEDALKLFSMESLIKGDYQPIHKVKLEKPCSWTATFKKDEKEAGLILVYQTGLIEIRSFPYLQVVGESSLVSILRWSFKTSMSKTICSSDTGQIVLVNGSEVAFISLFTFENDFGIPQTLPCLHDKVLEAATEAASFSQNQKKQVGVPRVLGGIIKGIKGSKAENRGGPVEDHGNVVAHLDTVFSRVPLSGTSTTISDDQEVIYLNIDDIDIDEPAPGVSSKQKVEIDKKGADKGTDRGKLFQGATSSTVTEPRMRTAEEIRAKYRKTVDASGAASQAKDKLLERGEKLEKLGRRTEELQHGAQNFAELANELVKTMEKRNKWWNI